MAMGLSRIALYLSLTLCAALVSVNAQNAVSAHSVSFVPKTETAAAAAVSAHSVSMVPLPTPPVSVHPISFVPKSTQAPLDPALSAHGLSFVPAPLTLAWSSTFIPAPESTSQPTRGSSKGKIAGGVAGGVAVLLAALGAVVFVRVRRNSTRHWRNRTAGVWQDVEGKAPGAGGMVYVGEPLGRPFDGYNRDVKVPVDSPPTTPAAPVFIRAPRIGDPFSGAERGRPVSSHYRDNSLGA